MSGADEITPTIGVGSGVSFLTDRHSPTHQGASQRLLHRIESRVDDDEHGGMNASQRMLAEIRGGS